MQVAGADALSRTCACDRERFLVALRSLPAEDLAEVFADGQAESICEFCGTVYTAVPEDLRAPVEASA